MIGRALRALGRAVDRVRAAVAPPLPEDDATPIPISWRDGESSPPPTPPSTPTMPAVPARMPPKSRA